MSLAGVLLVVALLAAGMARRDYQMEKRRTARLMHELYARSQARSVLGRDE